MPMTLTRSLLTVLIPGLVFIAPWLLMLVQHTEATLGFSEFQAFGFIGERLHILVFTARGEDTHVISLRKANKREVKRYEANKAQS